MSKKMVTAVFAAGSLALGLSGAAQAKSPVPGKPGTQNIVEIALDVNAALRSVRLPDRRRDLQRTGEPSSAS